MAYAIMRCKKLKGGGSVATALKHCYRERETANADVSRTPENKHYAARSTSEAMGKMRDLLPEKRRKDAVVAVEYLFTASPEWWKEASDQQQVQFFRASQDWLEHKYGNENIITASIHRDETSPHMSAFVIPLTKDKRLSAKEFIGDRHKMSKDQTSFAETVRFLGLERGLEGSKAHHTTIREYYARASASTPSKTPLMDLPEPKLLETKSTYGKRVATAAFDHMRPEVVTLRAKVQQADLVERKLEVAQQRKQQAEIVAQGAKARIEEANKIATGYEKKWRVEGIERIRLQKELREALQAFATLRPPELEAMQSKVKKNLLTLAQQSKSRSQGHSK